MKVIHDPPAVRTYLNSYGWGGMFSPAVEEKFQMCLYKAGEPVLRSGEKLPGLLLYVEGRSKVFRPLENGQTMLVRFYFPFQVMGDVELFTGGPALNSVNAVSEVRCLLLPTETVKMELKSNIPLLNHLARGLAGKLASFNATSAVNQNYPLKTRLADYLCLIFLEDGQYTEELKTVNLGEMADFLGCSYRHLTRTLEEFKTQGILEKRGRSFRILDPDALKEIAGDVFRSELDLSDSLQS